MFLFLLARFRSTPGANSFPMHSGLHIYIYIYNCERQYINLKRIQHIWRPRQKNLGGLIVTVLSAEWWQTNQINVWQSSAVWTGRRAWAVVPYSTFHGSVPNSAFYVSLDVKHVKEKSCVEVEVPCVIVQTYPSPLPFPPTPPPPPRHHHHHDHHGLYAYTLCVKEFLGLVRATRTATWFSVALRPWPWPCCFTSTEARDGDGGVVGGGGGGTREWMLDHGYRPKKIGETVDRCQNNQWKC